MKGKLENPYLTMPTKAQIVTGTLCSEGFGKITIAIHIKDICGYCKGFLQLLNTANGRVHINGLKQPFWSISIRSCVVHNI